MGLKNSKKAGKGQEAVEVVNENETATEEADEKEEETGEDIQLDIPEQLTGNSGSEAGRAHISLDDFDLLKMCLGIRKR